MTNRMCRVVTLMFALTGVLGLFAHLAYAAAQIEQFQKDPKKLELMP
jgi:hypothetical protein